MATKKTPADRPSGSRPSREGSGLQAQQQSSRSTPRDQAIGRMGPHLRAEFEQLARSESKIVKAMARPEVARAFASDPVAALEGIGVTVPPIIRQRLKTAASAGTGNSPLAPVAFRMPDGGVITPKVTIRFTKGPKAG